MTVEYNYAILANITHIFYIHTHITGSPHFSSQKTITSNGRLLLLLSVGTASGIANENCFYVLQCQSGQTSGI